LDVRHRAHHGFLIGKLSPSFRRADYETEQMACQAPYLKRIVSCVLRANGTKLSRHFALFGRPVGTWGKVRAGDPGFAQAETGERMAFDPERVRKHQRQTKHEKTEIHAMSGDYNMSMRKFLKQVGVTSQQAIEEGLRKADLSEGQSFEAKVVLTIDGLEVEHVVTGQIKDDNS
jgi:Family of unknown function (DUF6494)